MPNEFIARNGIIALNNTVVTGSVTATAGFTGSLFGTASWAQNSTSASYALTASSADNFVVRQSITASNALINGTITAQTLVVQTVTSSVLYSSGSNTFGNQLTNVQQFTGSLRVTGSGNHYIVGGNFGIDTTSPENKLDVSGAIGINTSGQARTISTFYGAGSDGFNIFIGGGGLSSGTGGGAGQNGSFNTSVGVEALFSNTTGYSNTANGYNALYTNTTGYSNTANGYNALFFNTTGYLNTANGIDALFNNTTGYQNTANGHRALQNNTTGYQNTANGVNALQNNTTGNNNIANGNGASLSNTTGIGNISVGVSSLRFNTTGSNNIAVGFNAGRFIADSSNNTITNNSIFIGYDTRAAADNQTNQIVIGYEETGLGNNTTIIGNSSTVTTALRGRLLLGSTIDNGTDRLQVSGSGKFSSNVTAASFTGSLFGTASWAQNVVGGASSAITVADEGTAQGTATFLNFTGAGVTATVSSNTASINIPGGAGAAFPYTGSAQITGSLGVTGSINVTQGITGSLFGTASLATTASYYQIVTGSAGTDFNIAASPSGSIINIPDASATARGLVTTGTQTIAGVKTFNNTTNLQNNIFNTDTGNSQGTTSTYLVSGYSTYAIKNTFNNTTTAQNTLGNGSTYYTTYNLFGNPNTNAPTSGILGLLASVTIKKLTVIAGVGTVTNAAALYVDGATTGATNNYSIWVSGGSTRLDGNLIMSGSNIAATGSISATQGFTGSLFGTASWATNFLTSSVTSASYAFTASSAVSAFTASSAVSASLSISASYAFTASSAVSAFTASSAVSSSLSVSSSFALTASFVNTLNQNVIISGSLTSTSFIRGTLDSAFAGTNGALRALNATNTAKRVDIGYDNTINGGYINVQEAGVDWRPLYINPLSTIASPVVIGASIDDGINKLQVTGNGRFVGSITASNALINGTITAQTLVVQTITSSTDFVTGSTRFGSLLTNTHDFTGSVRITGSLGVIGRATITDLTGSLFGTASWATNFLTSSVTSASYAFTASSAISSSYAFTASSAISAFTASSAVSSSLSVSASYAFTASSAISSSYAFTASSAISAFTASSARSASLSISASYAFTASSAISSSYAFTASSAISAFTASSAVSSSYALTASFLLGGASSAITVADEGTAQGTATFLNFTGAGVTATVSANTASINIPGGAGAAFPFSGSAQITGSLGVTGSVSVTNGGFTGSLFGTASLATTASYYQLVTGSSGTDVNIVASPSGSIINIPNASIGIRGLVSSDDQTFFATKTFVNNSVTSTSTPQLVPIAGGNSQVALKYAIYGSNGSPNPNESYGTLILGNSSINEAGTGTHFLVSNLLIRPLSLVNAAGSTINGATVYIEGPISGSATITNNYALWIDSGSARLDGDLIMSGSNILATGSISATQGFTGSLFGTSSWAVSASWAPGGAGGLVTKAGSVINSSFTGNPKKATVTFSTAFATTNYAITVTGEDARSWTIESKVAGSFVINANSNTGLAGTTYWIATAYGETT